MIDRAEYTQKIVETTLTLSATDMVRRSHLRQNMFAKLVVFFIKRVVVEMDNANYEKLAVKAVLESIKSAIDTKLQTGRWEE